MIFAVGCSNTDEDKNENDGNNAPSSEANDKGLEKMQRLVIIKTYLL